MATRGPAGQAVMTADEYEAMVYPGFLRRAMARWNEDGSCAPTARVRNAKGEPFTLLLTKQEVEDDLNALDAALRRGAPLPRTG